MNSASNNLLKYSMDETPKLHPYSADVSSPASAPETPNQLATDRATLAQEEEDAVQQQDSDEIGTETAFPPLPYYFSKLRRIRFRSIEAARSVSRNLPSYVTECKFISFERFLSG